MGRLEQILDMLPAELRSDEASRRVLEGLLAGPARLDRYLDLRRRALPDALSPDEAPERVLDPLMARVGMNIPATVAATAAEKRRLVGQAMRLWKVKGTGRGLRTICTALTGAPSLVWDWFALRTVSGSARAMVTLPAPSTAPAPFYAPPEHVTDVWYQDPVGVVNAALLGGLLEVSRGLGERINLREALLIDDLLVRATMWTEAAAGSYSYDAAARTLTAAAGGHYLAAAAGAAAWADYHALWRLAYVGGAELEVYQQADGSDEGYRLVITPTLVVLRRRRGAVDATLASAAITTAEGYAYDWSIEVSTGASSTTLRVALEGVTLITYTDATADRFGAGAVGWLAAGGADSATLHGALVRPQLAPTTRIGPNP